MKLDSQNQYELNVCKAIKASLPADASSNCTWNQQLQAWLCPEAPSIETFKIGDRFVTRQEIWEERIPFVSKTEPYADYNSAFPHWIRSRANELERWKSAAQEYCASPAMRLSAAQSTIADSLKKQQKRLTFMNCAMQAAKMWLEFTPEERSDLRQSMANTGALDCYQSFRALDDEVLNSHPDAGERADALAASKIAYRRLAAGADFATAFDAKERVLEDRKYARQMLTNLSLAAADVMKVLSENNGNKSAAAKALGISRAKMRRLTGERM